MHVNEMVLLGFGVRDGFPVYLLFIYLLEVVSPKLSYLLSG